MFWLLPRLMIITGTESYFLNSNLAGHCLDLQPLFRPSIRRFFLRLLWTAVYFAYIPKFIATQQTFDVFIPHLKTRRLFGADVQLRKSCLVFLKVTSFRGCFLGGMKILTPRRSQKLDHHSSAICFLNSVYMQMKGLYFA